MIYNTSRPVFSSFRTQASTSFGQINVCGLPFSYFPLTDVFKALKHADALKGKPVDMRRGIDTLTQYARYAQLQNRYALTIQAGKEADGYH